jgi:hypothetical protein
MATEFSEEVATDFCLRLADLGSVQKVCATEGMPSKATAFAWLRTKPSFLVMYQAAREDYAEGVFDELRLLMAEVPPKDAHDRTDMGAVRDKEVKIRTLQWMLGRLSPKKYSERMELVGAEGAALMPASDEMSEGRQFEGLRRFAFMLHKIGLEDAKPAPVVPLRLVHVPQPVRPPAPWERE